VEVFSTMSGSEGLEVSGIYFWKSPLEIHDKFSFQITTSSGFNFNFLNQDFGKKKSPSQLKRNKLRMNKFDQKLRNKVTGRPEADVSDHDG
jgi:hypothetical protein